MHQIKNEKTAQHLRAVRVFLPLHRQQLLLLGLICLRGLYAQLLGVPACRLSASLLLPVLSLLRHCSAFTLRTYKALLIFIVHI